MNWTHRRPFRQQFIGQNKIPVNRPSTYYQSKMRSNEPIDAIRLELADYHPPCPIHRNHPYISTFSDRQSSLQRTNSSSFHSISTIRTDILHQQVSTINTSPSPTSIIEQQQQILSIEKQPSPDELPTEHLQQCRNCSILIDIVDQQTQQIRQYAEQISEQAHLLAKLARRFTQQQLQILDTNTEPGK